jgi:Protein of unknown function (DUF2934)
MNLQEEIAKVARELYERSGRVEGRDRENWLDAERIVLLRHVSQEMEEPEGEEALIEEETIVEEVEATELKQTSKGSDEGTTVIEEIEVAEPSIAKKKRAGITEVPKKIMTARKGGLRKKAAVPERERSKRET